MLSWLKRRFWVVEYNHRHGADFSVFTSKDRAFRAAAETILTYLDELGRIDAQKQIAWLIAQGRYEEALRVWGDESDDHGESIDIEHVPINGNMQESELRAKAERAVQYLCESDESV